MMISLDIALGCREKEAEEENIEVLFVGPVNIKAGSTNLNRVQYGAHGIRTSTGAVTATC